MHKNNFISPFKQTLVILSILLFSLSSCDKKIDAELQWRIDNEKRFQEFEAKKEYKKTTIDGLTPYVLMKWIKKGNNKEYPIHTSRVIIHYEVYLLAGNKSFIDGNYDQERGLRLALDRGNSNQSIVGIQIALQNMVEGDETEVIIPWYLAYGSTPQEKIRPYSGLRYLIRLDKIIPEKE